MQPRCLPKEAMRSRCPQVRSKYWALGSTPEPYGPIQRQSVPNPLDWWSLKPLQHSSFPIESSHAIDAFVDSKLVESGLKMSDEADSRSLCRRLYFDLIGLPPTPEQVEAFVNDSRDQSSATAAYDRLVTQLLNSPRYGERWARHWLDVVRFAESDGFETISHGLMRGDIATT